MSLLEVKDIHVYYGNIHAIKGVDLKVDEGEVVSLIGANGAGKTTILKTISGLLNAVEGEIVFKGKNIEKCQPHKIARMGISQVPEGRRVFAGLSVEDNLELGAFALNTSSEENDRGKERIYEYFPVLKERRNQKAGTLSGGEQQMLAMGRALMGRPELILLDEPSMGLSPIFVDIIYEVIRKLKKENRTILLVEQNVNIALSVSDRYYVLETGNIVNKGLSSEVKDDSSIKAAYLGA